MGGRHAFQHRWANERPQSQTAPTCETLAIIRTNRDLSHALVRNHKEANEAGERALTEPDQQTIRLLSRSQSRILHQQLAEVKRSLGNFQVPPQHAIGHRRDRTHRTSQMHQVLAIRKLQERNWRTTINLWDPNLQPIQANSQKHPGLKPNPA